MYIYDEIDQRIVDERVAQFRDQTQRYLDGKIVREEYLPLRLQNGLYMQRHAHMLRIAIPYGLVSSKQMRMFAHIVKKYDKNYGHFSTRQNLQINWPELKDVPDILADLATVQMHAIQTSGNCVRNVTADQFAGVAPDEIVDSFVWCEVIRQWSTFHPEFARLPRKFKIAVNGAQSDRAAVMVHDIGLHAVRSDDGLVGFRVVVGGGLGRTPIIGSVIREFLPWPHLLTYLDAIMRVYNRYGRRDNKAKARIKIIVKEFGAEKFASMVEEEWAHLKDGPATLIEEEVQRVESRFTRPIYENLPANTPVLEAALATNKAFAAWHKRNVHPHKVPGYAAVTLSLKPTGIPPGDATSEQMTAVADMMDQYSQGECRITHEQNIVLASVKQSDLLEIWEKAKALGFATPNIGLLTNIICCPGGDFCSLANAKSIPIAQAIQERFDDLDYLWDIGDLDLNISGCMNSCGHHHVGHIGILGVDKQGEEWYQVSIGGAQGNNASIGKVIGRSFAQAEIPDVIEKLINCYIASREHEEERFIDTVRRIGMDPFKEYVYGKADQGPSGRAGQLATA
jgi:sulfite reductase (NADPH) hemoprotein beta-component